MDRIIVVTADEGTQVRRLMQRNTLSEHDALKRIRAQMPLAEKIKLADYVIDGTATRERVRQDVKRIYEELKRSA